MFLSFLNSFFLLLLWFVSKWLGKGWTFTRYFILCPVDVDKEACGTRRFWELIPRKRDLFLPDPASGVEFLACLYVAAFDSEREQEDTSIEQFAI